MWKYTKVCVNPRRRKYTFPHVEIHMRSCISACGNTHFGCISTCGNSSGKVYFRMSIYKRIREFPRGKTCGNTRFFEDFHMRKYTRKCEFPRAEIHAEMCITACGNTLNQVQKNSSKYTPWVTGLYFIMIIKDCCTACLTKNIFIYGTFKLNFCSKSRLF